MADKLKMHSADIVDENIEFIASRWPNAVKEVREENGILVKKVDFDVLKQELSKELISEKQERYQMTWPDKKKSILLTNSSINGTLRPLTQQSVDFENTKNIYIEGDNLDVLKLLRETYLNRIKMIYIDPPYNTGNDFVYEDDFSQGNDEYLSNSGQFDEQGKRLFVNNESNGRFHTDWLNMIYPRLKIAKDILSDDGIILISIDDIELYNLKKVCDEIFGEQNHVATFVWKSKSGGANDARNIATDTEYVLCYARYIENVKVGVDKEAEVTTSYNQEDEKGKFSLDRLDKQSLGYLASLDFPIVGPDGKEYVVQHKDPEHKQARWRWGKDTVKDRYDELVFRYPFVYTKNYEKEGVLPRNLMIDERFGRSRTGKTEVRALFDNKVYFDFPKPTKLINFFINIFVMDNDSTVMDFFSGSGTTGDSIYQCNFENNTSNKFILVQLPELLDPKSNAGKDGFRTICDIGEERIRRAGKKIKEENPLTTQNLDTGFRVLKLDSSNMKDVYYNPKKVQQSLLSEDIDNVKEDRTALDLLFQVMLDLGIELSAKITEKTIDGKLVYCINDNYLVACFAKDISDEVVRECAKISPVYIVFRDASFANDSSNINCEQVIKTVSPSTELKVI